MKTVTIAIPSLHRPDLTERCIDFIQRQTLPRSEWEIVVVENEARSDSILPDPLPENTSRIELPTNGVDGLCDVLGRSRRRALEQHVLDEMGNAAAIGALVARPAREPHPNADRADLGHPLGEKTKAVIENVCDDR